MTRVIILPDEHSLAIVDSSLSADELMERIESGRWNPPPPYTHWLYSTEDRNKLWLRVLQWEGLVIVSIANAKTDVDGEAKPKAVRHPVMELSSRQREVLQLLAEGLTTKEIALKLNLHQRTIAAHIAEIKERLGTQTRAQMVGRGTIMGLCEPGLPSTGSRINGIWD